jgi:hypothetical protein
VPLLYSPSWFLLMMISVVLVSLVHRPEEEPVVPSGAGDR